MKNIKLIARIALMALILVCAVILCACAKDETTTLYVYNWGEYIADGTEGSADVNALFEQYYYEKTGKRVKVNYSTFSSCEDMYARVSSGVASYDVIIPSDYIIDRMRVEGLLLPIYPEKNVENYKYINDNFKNLPYDPDNVYSVPYFYGMIGVIYNSEMVDEDEENIGSWKLMWDEDYAGDILQFNNSRDAFGVSMYSLGYGNYINSSEDKYWNEALDHLLEQKSIVQGYVMDEIFNKMEGGSAAVAAYYAGDYLTMYEFNDSLEFYYPTEGTNYYVDAMCVPTTSKNPEIAIEYINFMTGGETEIDGEVYNISVENALMTYYASPNELVYTDEYYFKYMEDYFTDEEREEDGEEGIRPGTMAILYPEELPAILEARGMTEEEYFSGELDPDKLALWTKPEIVTMYANLEPDDLVRLNILWEKLKIKSDIGNRIYITCGVIVAALIFLAVYFGVRKKRREKYYTPKDTK